MQCCMPLCENTSENFSKCGKITFHEFPSEPSLRAAWIRALGIQGSQLPDAAVVCSQHFLHDDICETESGSRQLHSGAVPSTVLVCMICLDTDSKMSPISQYKLEEAYEKLTEHPLWDGGNLIQTLCVQCAQQLRNFSRFREQSLKARSLMMELLKKHEVIAVHHIKMIQHENNTQRNNLVTTMLRPDPCDMYIVGNSYEDRQTGSQETVHGVTVKTECSEDSQWKDENTQIKVENADCVKKEFNIELLKCESAEFMCTVCCEQFPHEHAYREHVRTQHDARPAAASPHTAGAKIKVESSPQTLLTVSSVVSLNACIACDVVQCRAQDEVAATHKEPAASVLSETEPGTSGHSSRTHCFICDVCKHAFTRKDHLVRHMKSHTDERLYRCNICCYKCTQSSKLVIHMRIHTGEKPYSCKICSYKFTQSSNLIRHMSTHIVEKPYSCDTCSYKCTRKGDLVRHMRSHTGEKLYSCEMCSYKFTQRSKLVTHMTTHSGEKPYSCATCSYQCTRKGDLVRHMRTHTGEKPYSCDICSYKFADNSNLVTHIRTHTGEKPYSCKICSYKFSQKGNLVKHNMRSHTGDEPYSCKVCNYKFSQKGSLVTHMRSHTGKKAYYCKICSYKCGDNSHLVTHMRTHTGEKPYSCETCSYKCTKKGDLVRHIRTHTGEKPYSCNICSYKFSQKCNLVKHMRTHTGAH